MAGKPEEVRALEAALPQGVALTNALRADPRLRLTMLRISGGLIVLFLHIGPRSYAVGIADDALVILPLPRWRGDPPAQLLRRSAIKRLTIKRGLFRTKITLDTATEHYRLRVPGAAARCSRSAQHGRRGHFAGRCAGCLRRTEAALRRRGG